MPYHPYCDNGGTHWGLWIVMIVAMLIFFAILAWAVVSVIRQRDVHRRGEPQSPSGTGSSDALRILDERFARGEIEVDEYTKRRDLLKESGSATAPG